MSAARGTGPGRGRAGRTTPGASGPGALAALALLAAAACGGGTAAPAPPAAAAAAAAAAGTWPPGTALLVGDVAIPAREVEAAADAMAECNPAFTRRGALREALIAHLVPNAAVRAHHPAEAEIAHALARADIDALRSGAPSAPDPIRLSGSVRELPFDAWRRARDLAPGTWDGPWEAPGAWISVRLVERTILEGLPASHDAFEIDLVQRAFMPEGWTPPDATRCMAELTVTVVDPACGEALPLGFREQLARVVEAP